MPAVFTPCRLPEEEADFLRYLAQRISGAHRADKCYASGHLADAFTKKWMGEDIRRIAS